jgi:tryptophan halogenase
MKKLTVIGRGTVGVGAVGFFLRHTDWDIDWMYDPNIIPTSVGEGTNLSFPRMLGNTVDFDGIGMDRTIATSKLGIWKRGWGSGNDFKHTFPAGQVGMHFSAVELQNYLFEKLSRDRRVRLVESNSTNHEDIDSDYIMVCTGTPKEITFDYVLRDKIPVNAATVFQCPWDNAQFNWSLTFAKKYGWVFGIPLKTRCSIGYIYNSDWNKEDEVTEDVQELLDEFGLVPESTRTLHFSNYSKKQNYTDRIIYNGNASYFLEPLEATSTGFATGIMQNALQVWNGTLSVKEAQLTYNTQMDEIESMICLHYLAGSIYKTPFWDMAKKLGLNKIESDFKKDNEIAKIIKKSLFHNSKYHNNGENNLGEVGTWPVRSYVQNIDGMNIREKIKSLL